MIGAYTLKLKYISIFIIAIIACAMAGMTANSYAAGKKALLIGNAAYSASPLKNPVNDVVAVGAQLKKIGFEVTVREDLTHTQMDKTVREYAESLTEEDLSIFYFAGHGVQVKNSNYLIPVNANIHSEVDVRYKAMDLNYVMESLLIAKNHANVLIIDACRDNPFVTKFRSFTRGLAKVNIPSYAKSKTEGPSGMIVAYSTAPGHVAFDGTGNNSIYAENFIKVLDEPGHSIEKVFKNVRQSVEDATDYKQSPREETSLRGELVLNELQIAALETSVVNNSTYSANSSVNVINSGNGQYTQQYITNQPAQQFTNQANQGQLYQQYNQQQGNQATQYQQQANQGQQQYQQQYQQGNQVPQYQQQGNQNQHSQQQNQQVNGNSSGQYLVGSNQGQLQQQATNQQIQATQNNKNNLTNSATSVNTLNQDHDIIYANVDNKNLGINNRQNTSVNQTINQTTQKYSSSLNNTPSLPEVYDRLATGSAGPLLRLIPQGNFTMGGSRYNERPKHKVEVNNAFVITASPITNRDYDVYLKAKGNIVAEQRNATYLDKPITNINWHDAMSYANWLSSSTGKQYRLPSEAEWEYAVRGGFDTKYWWGENINKSNLVCKDCNSKWDNIAPVKAFPANQYGLFSTYGNVWEWVADCWVDSYIGASPSTTPRVIEGCPNRTLRGGAYNSKAKNISSAARLGASEQNRTPYFGFRLVREVSQTEIVSLFNGSLGVQTTHKGSATVELASSADSSTDIRAIIKDNKKTRDKVKSSNNILLNNDVVDKLALSSSNSYTVLEKTQVKTQVKTQKEINENPKTVVLQDQDSKILLTSTELSRQTLTNTTESSAVRGNDEPISLASINQSSSNSEPIKSSIKIATDNAVSIRQPTIDLVINFHSFDDSNARLKAFHLTFVDHLRYTGQFNIFNNANSVPSSNNQRYEVNLGLTGSCCNNLNMKVGLFHDSLGIKRDLISSVYNLNDTTFKFFADQLADIIYSKIINKSSDIRGQYAFIKSVNGQNEIRLAKSHGKQSSLLMKTKAAIYQLAWSPDGQRICYTSEESGKAEKYIQEVYTGQKSKVNSPPSWCSNTLSLDSLSPNGTLVAKVIKQGSVSKLDIQSAYSNQSAYVIGGGSEGNVLEAAWSPSGQLIR